MRLSAKQTELYLLDEHDHQMVIAVGTVRSGKTWAGLFGLLRYAGKYFNQHQFIVGIQSEFAWRETIQPVALKWEELTGYRVHWTEKYFTVSNDHGGTNRFVRVIGHDVKAAKRAASATISGVYATEVTHMHPDVLEEFGFRTLQTRGRKLVYDCNPENSAHWFRLNYVLRAKEIGAKHFSFTEQDNPAITPEMWEQIKRETPPGPQYRRRILGEWCDATGLVWDVETPNAVRYPPDAKPKRFDVSVDTATSSVTHALLVAHYANTYAVVDEWRHDGRIQGELTTSEQVERICSRFNAHANGYGLDTGRWVIDPASAHFKAEVQAAHKKGLLFGRIYATNNNVKYGLDSVSYYLSRRYLTISPACKGLIRDIGGYIWDELATEKGEDRPVKKDDHGCDALRYWCVMHNQSKRKRPAVPTVMSPSVR